MESLSLISNSCPVDSIPRVGYAFSFWLLQTSALNVDAFPGTKNKKFSHRKSYVIGLVSFILFLPKDYRSH